MLKRRTPYIFLIICLSFIVIGLVSCTEDESDKSNENNTETAAEENLDSEPDDLDEETIDPLANLLETAPKVPTNLDEIINYPVGPLAGNGSIKGKEPVMESEELAEEVKEILPEVKENADEEYLEKWWRGFRYLFAEDYPNPTKILKKLEFEHFGNPGLEDERFHFKDQLNVLVILDVSGSMANMINGKPMMDIAKDSINSFVSDLPNEANIGLRVYGHEGKPTGKTKEESCLSSDLVYDIQPIDKQEFSRVIEPFQPTGWTPIGLSLEEAKEDFAGFPSEENTNLVYVVSDGAETCGGDPVKAAEDLVDSNIEPIINVIGFNVDVEGQSHLREIAEAGGGLYTNAGDEEQLSEAFDQAEEMIEKWNEWKKEAKVDVRIQKSEKRTEAIFQRNDWLYFNSDESFITEKVLMELYEDDYITKEAKEYIEQKSREREALFEEIKEMEYEDLLDEIEESFDETMREINEEYDENIDN